MSTNDDNTRLKRELKDLAEALSNNSSECLTCGRQYGNYLCMHCSLDVNEGGPCARIPLGACAVCVCGDDDDDSE